jgi:hypothetical protein
MVLIFIQTRTDMKVTGRMIIGMVKEKCIIRMEIYTLGTSKTIRNMDKANFS